MRSTIHVGLKVSPFELHRCRKLITELTNIINDTKNYLSDWTTLNFSVPGRQIPIYVAQNEKREVTDHIIMASKSKTLCYTSHKSPKRRSVKAVSVSIQWPYTLFEKRNQTYHWKGNMKNKRELP